MVTVAKIAGVRYLPGTGWDFGYDREGREWVSVDPYTEDLEGYEVDECHVCGEHIENGWFCRDTRQAVCESHVEVDWDGYSEDPGERKKPIL